MILCSSKINLLLVGFVVACCLPMVGAATGKTEDNDTDSTGITAAGPRLGPVAVVEVIFANRHALDELIRQGYDISGVRGNVATIYATPEELDRLIKAGYDCRIIEWQPNPPGPGATGLGNYHSYSSLTVDLQAYAAAHTNICRLYTLGLSVQGRELWALLITDNPDDEEDEPEFKYVSTMHGNEPVGTEMCLYFIDLLLTEYGTNPRITGLVDSTAIWIVPLMNPDGLELGSRYNANGYDINRSFPAYPEDFTENMYHGPPMDTTGLEPEVVHIMRWTADNSFVLSANFHTGALVANYPYDDDGKGSVDSPTPDDLLFEDISRRYSMHNTPMWNSSTFPDGITNGAAWYAISGGMQDWNYRYVSCNATTIELSDNFKPPESEIPAFWADNEESMLSYLQAVRIGVRGIITDSITGEPLYAEVWVEDINHPVFTDPDIGDYHRMLLPGIYNLTFNAPGYVPRLVKNVSVSLGAATRIDVELVAEDALADFDENGIVDFKDFSFLAYFWSDFSPTVDIGPPPYGDGIIDFKDVGVFSENWLLSMMQASNPKPDDGATGVDIATDLSWTPGDEAALQEVYFGSDLYDLPLVATQPAGQDSYDPGDPNLMLSTTYYWRIDEVNDAGPPPGKWPGVLWSFTTVRGQAHTPSPADDAAIPGTDGEWPSGNFFIYTSLDVVPGPTANPDPSVRRAYFSKNRDDVVNRIQDANLGPPPYMDPCCYQPDPDSYIVGLPASVYEMDPYAIVPETGLESLERGEVYYWCVDEADADGRTFGGDIWEFTIQGFYAFEPSPPNDAILVDPNVVLSWGEGYGASKHDVYLGTSWDDVNNAYFDFVSPSPEHQGTTNMGVLSWQCSGLPTDTKIYWRIDEVQGRMLPLFLGIIYKGDVWSFTTGVPSPP